MGDYNDDAWQAFQIRCMLGIGGLAEDFNYEGKIRGAIDGVLDTGNPGVFDFKVKNFRELANLVDEKSILRVSSKARAIVLTELGQSLEESGLTTEAGTVATMHGSEEFTLDMTVLMQTLMHQYAKNKEYGNGNIRNIMTSCVGILRQFHAEFRREQNVLEDSCGSDWCVALKKGFEGLTATPKTTPLLCVSMSWGYNLLSSGEDIICASIISDKKRELFRCDGTMGNRRLGWVFCPGRYELIGMSPSDAGSYKGVIGGAFNVNALFAGYTYLTMSTYAHTPYADFIRIYPLDYFMQKTNKFNEVILHGRTDPIALFVLQCVCESPDDVRRVNILADVFNKPIVCYDPNTNTARKVRALEQSV